MAHRLDIEPGTGGHIYQARLVFDDGTEEWFQADERARIISKAQMAIEARALAQEVTRETLLLDDDGVIVREPSEHSVKA